jgi:hypothetical protein
MVDINESDARQMRKDIIRVSNTLRGMSMDPAIIPRVRELHETLARNLDLWSDTDRINWPEE